MNRIARRIGEHLENGDNVLIVTTKIKGRQLIHDVSKINTLSIDFNSISDNLISLSNGTRAFVESRTDRIPRRGFDIILFDASLYVTSAANEYAYKEIMRESRISGAELEVFTL